MLITPRITSIGVKGFKFNSIINPRKFIFVFLGTVFIIISLISGNTNRLFSIFNLTEILNDDRGLELVDLISQSNNIFHLIIGRGLGGGINSTIYKGEFTQSLHLGILNIFLKFGIIAFIFFVLFIFRKFFYYLNTLFLLTQKIHLNGESFQKIVSTDFFLLPMLFPWFVFLFISGGFAEIPFFTFGFYYYTSRFYSIKEFIKL
jgi:hypothetical protein